MRAMVLREFGVPLQMEEYPTPIPKDGELLIRVGATGLCATDIKIVQGKIAGLSLPVVPGHELAGEVVNADNALPSDDWQPGQQVAIHMCLPCGDCRSCTTGWENNCEAATRVGYDRPGGFGEYVAIPADRCVPIAPEVTADQAAIIAGSIATPLHALYRRAQLTSEDTIVIFGMGGLGIHAMQIARYIGATVVAVDIDEVKLEAATSLGANHVINGNADVSALVKEITNGRGADIITSFVGGAALPKVVPQAISSLRRCGRLVIAGYLAGVPVTIDSDSLVLQTWDVLGARSSTIDDLRAAVELVESGTIRPIISETRPMESLNVALQDLESAPPLGRIAMVW